MLFSTAKLRKALIAILLTTLLLSFSNKCLAQCNGQIDTLSVLNPLHKLGTFPLQKYGIFICYNDTLKVELDGYELMDSQKLYYVYHSETDVLNSLIIDIDTMKTDGFINRNDTLEKLYATAIISNSRSNNWLEDSCTLFSNTVEFYFLAKVGLATQVEPVSDKEYIVRVFIEGGMPEFDSRYKYFLTGDIKDEMYIFEIARFNVESDFGERFSLYIMDSNGCKDSHSYILSSLNHTLPTELISFDGQSEGANHLLKWVTGYETNNDYFLLEVSKNGRDFEVLDSINGAGSTSHTSSYRFIHENVLPGNYTYQLSLVSFDGDIDMIVTFELNSYALHAFPNPTNNKLRFHFNGAQFKNLAIHIFDSTGKKVLSFDKAKIWNTRNDYLVDVYSLKGGIYFAQIWADNFKRVEKFIVEK